MRVDNELPSDALIEFSPDGKQLRTVAQVKDALALAVSPRGEIAVALAAPNGAFYVLKLDPAGKPLQKIMRTGWNDVGDEKCDGRKFERGLRAATLDYLFKE